jgi:hypothetical protein
VTYVYFIKSEQLGLIKIGKSTNPVKRICNMQTSTPDRLVLLGYSDQHTEKELHHRFSSLRQTGEWFSPSEDLLRFISGLGPVAAPPIKHGKAEWRNHPLGKWAASRGMDLADLVECCHRSGITITLQSLRHVVMGYRIPHYERAKEMAAVTEGAVHVLDIMEYRRESAKDLKSFRADRKRRKRSRAA